MKTCVVSGGTLGGMGKPVEYVYQQAGQPDRTVIFCRRACIKKFEKDPTKFLAKLDAAETPPRLRRSNNPPRESRPPTPRRSDAARRRS